MNYTNEVQQIDQINLIMDNPNMELMVLSTGDLISGQPYQRSVEPEKVDYILHNWNPYAFDNLIVSHRDGKFYLVDGQHRVAVLKHMNGGKDLNLVCKVLHGLTYEDEADLCYKLDKGRNQLSLSESINTLIESRTDPNLLEIKRLLETNGFTWGLIQRTGSDYEIGASRAVIRAYKLLGIAGFDRLLKLLRNTWHGIPTSLKGDIISGMALFLKTYEAELQDNSFTERMSGIAPEEIIRCSKLDFSTNKLTKRYARAILEKYNAQRGKPKLAYRLG